LMFFCIRDTARPTLFTLSLHDALPILAEVFELLADLGLRDDRHDDQPVRVLLRDRFEARRQALHHLFVEADRCREADRGLVAALDRKSTRLNSSHVKISYAVFCLKKKI